MELQEKNANNCCSSSEKVPKFGVRHQMAILLHTFLLLMFSTRAILSLAIVAMTDPTASSNPNIPTYDWTNTGVILSAFFWSYVVLQPFSGYIFLRFGLKRVIFITSLINSLTFFIIPFIVFQWEYNGLIVCRVVQGLCQGFFYPGVLTAFGIWSPMNERSFISMIVQGGFYLAYIVSMLTTGYISASWWGWPAVFYIFGGICVLWCIVWWSFAADSPNTHPRITKIECKYIEESLQSDEKTDNKSIPLKAILTSVPFWSAVMANLGYSWILTITETQVPTYLKNIMNFDISSNGVAAASPYIVQLVLTIPLAPLGDFLVSRKYVPLMTWRRISQVLGAILPAFAIVWLAFIRPEQTTLAMFLLNVGLGMQSIILFGSAISHVDLTPRFAGVAFCIDNTIGQILCIFAPLTVQYFVTDLTDIVLWRAIFLSMAGLYILTSLVYMIFGSATIQWWNNGPKRKDIRAEIN